ncbi:MAG: hypothetical protein IJ272_05840 [Clostridia bacterium]|nr:hypothetical protein [Clostridia bacterium]
MNNKNGNATTAITLIVSLGFLLVLAIYIINTIIPFIWYQKLQAIANKYIYVVERFGYLTDTEEKELYKELEEDGFDLNYIQLECPKSYLEYGTLFKFEITYNLNQEYNVIADGIKNEAKTVPLRIRKYGYSKM